MDTRIPLRDIAAKATSRAGLWTDVVNALHSDTVAEIGVFQGHFAAELLRECASIRTYLMVDPWRHLDDWDKPSNKSDERHNQRYEETLRCTDFAKEKRVILRGTTSEVIDDIANGSLDFIYIDGDHTLRGITIDLIKLWPKLKGGGWIGCDDFCSDIWQHSKEYEPTFIFPYVVYFSQAVSAELYALPFSQCLLRKPVGTGEYSFTDFVGVYGNTTVRRHLLKYSIPMWKVDAFYNRLKKVKRAIFHR